MVVIIEVDGDDARLVDVPVVLQRRPLHASLGGAEEEEMFAGLEILDVEEGDDPFAFLQFEQVDDGAALARARQFGDLVDLLAIDAPRVGEAEQVVVRRGDEQVLEEVVVLGGRALDADAPAPSSTCSN